MSNCSDNGLQGSSKLDGSWMEFIADGPGIAGFSMKPDPEQDGDAFAASFDPFLRPENTETCFSEWDDDGRHLSLEALEGLGTEFGSTDPNLDADDDRDEEPDRREMEVEFAVLGIDYVHYKPSVHANDMDPKYLRERPEGTVEVFRGSEAQAMVVQRQGSPVFNTVAICRKAVEAAQLVSKALVAEEKRKAVEAKAIEAKPLEPAKGNGHKPATPPPVGKFLKGTVVDQGPKGLLVDAGGIEVRVPIALEQGHGSWERAAAWILGFEPGIKVRLKVVRVNGVIEAVLSDRHPRPFWKKEASQRQTEAPAAN